MKKRFVMLLVVLVLLMSMAVPAYAADNTYVFDTIGLLDEYEAAELEQMCAAATVYDCGIYVVLLNDFSMYHSDPRLAAEELYRQSSFGLGENKNGILLMLSMSERDYALVCYGDLANSVFTDRVQDRIVDDFLDDFGVNNWEGGLSDYVAGCIDALENFDGTIGEVYPGYYEDGVYYEPSIFSDILYTWSEFGFAIVPVSLLIAGLVCIGMKRSMKTARISHTAEAYIPRGGVDLTVREDVFTHTTRRVIHHERDNGSSGGGGGTSIGSSGFSGRSGKF